MSAKRGTTKHGQSAGTPRPSPSFPAAQWAQDGGTPRKGFCLSRPSHPSHSPHSPNAQQQGQLGRRGDPGTSGALLSHEDFRFLRTENFTDQCTPRRTGRGVTGRAGGPQAGRLAAWPCPALSQAPGPAFA